MSSLIGPWHAIASPRPPPAACGQHERLRGPHSPIRAVSVPHEFAPREAESHRPVTPARSNGGLRRHQVVDDKSDPARRKSGLRIAEAVVSPPALAAFCAVESSFIGTPTDRRTRSSLAENGTHDGQEGLPQSGFFAPFSHFINAWYQRAPQRAGRRRFQTIANCVLGGGATCTTVKIENLTAAIKNINGNYLAGTVDNLYLVP